TWMASAQARSNPPRNYRYEGMVAVSEGRYADAPPALTFATQTAPDDGEAWVALGRSHIAQSEWKAAKADMERAAELRAQHGPTQATLAWALSRIGYFDEALAALDRAEQAGYAPPGLYALRGIRPVSRRQDALDV